MGQVYRATDTNLKRQVAIKVLPASLAGDADRLARFQREAEVLAALNHPNIAQIFGLEKSGGTHALVMELVEGEDMSQRILRGAIPVDEALPIARQIAEALEAAHDHGIIHRDLKPANIKLRSDGTVKVLDFGLAKAMEPSGAMSPNPTQSPTITTPAMTQAGMILGTAAYMSPEQAKGRPVDKRSDVWAFGAVLYEMLTGKRAFEGEDVSDTLAAVLRGEPDWSGLATNVPPAMVILIKRCLQKDRRERIGGMSAARFVLFETDLVVPASRASDASIGGVFARYPAAAAAVLFLAGAIAAAAIARSVMQPPAVASQPVARFAVPLGPDQQFSGGGGGFPVVALSPTGTDIVYVANNALYLRPLDRLEATSIRGIEGKGLDRPVGPFFSPDGQWIGFWQSGYLKKASVTGGAPAVVYKADFPFGASWEEDDTIIFGAGADGIWRVRSDGGQAENLIKVDLGQYARGPQLLPGGRTLVFTLLTSQSGPAEQASQNERAPGQRLDQLIWDDAQVVVQSLDTGERRVLIEGATDARYAPSGHLVFASRGSVFAVPFDATNLAVGGRVTVAENVAHHTGTGTAHFTLSRTGSFAYVSGSFSRPSRRIAWVDRQGRESPINAEPRAYMYPRVSPDGTRLAVTIDGPQQDIWILDLTTGGESAVDFGSC